MKEEELRGKRAFAKEKLQEKKEKMKKKRCAKGPTPENEEKEELGTLQTCLNKSIWWSILRNKSYETPELGQIDRLAKKNYEQELEIKQKEAGSRHMKKSSRRGRVCFRAILIRLICPVETRDDNRNMNAHLESQIKEVRDSYPRVLKVLDKWVAKLQDVEDLEVVEDPVSE